MQFRQDRNARLRRLLLRFGGRSRSGSPAASFGGRKWASGMWMLAAVVFVSMLGVHPLAAEQMNVALVSRTMFNLPLWVADKKGFFKEEGLEVRFEIVNSAEAIKERLQTGAAHVSLDTPEVVMLDAYNGGSLRIIAGNARKLPHFIIAKPAIKSLKDLRGARFGVLSVKEGTASIVPKIAAAAGLSKDDYTILAVGGAPTRWRLLKEGSIDAGLQPFPLSYEAEAAGFTNLGWVGEYESDWQFTTFNTNEKWAQSNPELVTKFLRATLKGQAFADAHPQEAAEIIAPELQASVPLTLRAIQDSRRLGILDPLLDWSGSGIQKLFGVLKQNGSLPQLTEFDLKKVSQSLYLERAQASIRR